MAKKMWDLKQKADDPKTLDLFIYGDVEAITIDWVNCTLKESENSANAFRKALEEHSDAEQINIYINSWGGSVAEGTAIYSQLRRHPAQKTVYVDGFACSIASVIAMAGDKIIMPRNTMMMIHNMAWSVYGNAAELRKAADDLDVINKCGQNAYLEKAGGKLDEKTLSELMNAETWLPADRCFELGLCDEVQDRDADMKDAAEAIQKTMQRIEQRIDTSEGLAAQLRKIVEYTKTPAKDPEKPAEQATKPGGLFARFSHQ
ncbi:MAG: Clp protease ClpP [Fibrobacter sp.]|nr:Clp protease ClpP [Clostridia bacterium]MBR4680720.1 Clp protease ClpP [Fibrobacter sp.]